MTSTLLILDHTSEFPSLLLELTVSGVVYRFAELGPCEVESDDGDTHWHAGLVLGSIEESIDLWGTSASPRSVSVQVYLDGLVDAATLLSAGVELYSASARVLLWDGGAYEDCQVVASGPVVDPIYGQPDEPMSISFAIERDLDDRALIPAASAYLLEDSFVSLTTGQADDGELGCYYPIIIGKPGFGPSPLGGRWKAAPSVRGNIGGASPGDQRIVIAGHAVVASEVHVWTSNNTNEAADVLETVDDYGNVVAYIDLTSVALASDYSGQGTGPTVIAWTEHGHPGLDGDGLEGLGDVVIWAMQQTSLSATGVDWPRIHGMRQALNSLGKIATWIDQRISPLSWLIQVLSSFPCYVADSGSGIYVGIWNYLATATDAVCTIDTAVPGYARIAPVSWSGGSDVANDIQIEGGFSVASNAALTTRRWSGDPAVLVADVSVHGHPLLVQSRTLFGTRETMVSVPTVEDVPTLDRIGSYHVFRLALPRAEVGYRVPWRKVTLELGDVVAIEDEEVGLVNRLGIVTGRRYEAGEYQLRISLLPQL